MLALIFYAKVKGYNFCFGHIILIRKILTTVFSIFIAWFVCLNNPAAFAQASDACDPEFEKVINARAEMEAMREVEMAQTYILKPDSVLEYSCFFHRYEEVGEGANIFSDNVKDPPLYNKPAKEYKPGGKFPQFLPEISKDKVTAPRISPEQDKLEDGAQPPEGVHQHHTNNAIGVLTSDSEFNHIFSSFGHVYAGGTYASVAAANGCNPMQLVWMFAKCWDFPKDDFRTFLKLGVIDPRIVPSYLALSCNNSSRYTKWATNYAQANSATPGSAGGVEPVVTYVEKFDPAECASHDPVPTGVSVFRGAPPVQQSYVDAMCIAPGCYYDGAACVQ